jgi:hypothetical protein
MELRLQRRKITDISCIGDLYIDGEKECFTLEDPPKAEKIPGTTGIPAGRYRVIVDFSNRFQTKMPLLLGVPGFEGVRIHAGTTPADTEGCILVGDVEKSDWIEKSRIAFMRLFKKLWHAVQREKVWIEVIDP